MITDAEIMSNRKVWTGAMRSGRYLQGRSRMRAPDDRYCCLGVFCETGAVPGQWEEYSDANTFMWACASGEYSSGALSPLQRAAVGLSTDEHNRLVHLNDGRRLAVALSYAERKRLTDLKHKRYEPFTFAQIADYIDSLPIERETP